MGSFNKICKDIKDVKIQGAENIAKAALTALEIKDTPEASKKLISLRPTEPCLVNAIHYAHKHSIKKAFRHFDYSQEKINEFLFPLIKNNSVIYTHCHSSTVVKALIYAKKNNKKFTVNNTETRPRFQGRKTSIDLAKAGIHNNHFVDSAIELAMKDASLVLLGSDSITPHYVYNKVGSELVASTAKRLKIPVYIITDSWKFDRNSLKHQETEIEERSYKEVWENKPSSVKVHNPAFERIPKENISFIISEIGALNFKDFINKVKKGFE